MGLLIVGIFGGCVLGFLLCYLIFRVRLQNIRANDTNLATDPAKEAFMRDFDDFINKHHDGNYKVRFDEAKYVDNQRHFAKQINSIIEYYVADYLELFQVLKQYADGDFSAKTSTYVGEWAWANEVMNSLQVSLNRISKEVKATVKAVAIEGNLRYKTNVVGHKGEWQEIMQGLDNLVSAVDDPIEVLDMAFKEVTVGNFDLDDIDKKIISAGLDANPENYGGVFKQVMVNFNTMLEDIASYIDELEKVLAQMANGDLRNRIDRTYVG